MRYQDLVALWAWLVFFPNRYQFNTLSPVIYFCLVKYPNRYNKAPAVDLLRFNTLPKVSKLFFLIPKR